MTSETAKVPTYSLELAPIAPFAAAAVAATTVWIEAGKSLNGAYVSHFAALALADRDASAAQIMAGFTRDVPDSKVKGTPAVTKSQIGRALRDSTILAAMRADYVGVNFAGMDAADFAKCVEGAATVLKAGMNALKHAPAATTGVTGASVNPAPEVDAEPKAPVSEEEPAPSDVLDILQGVMASIAALRVMARDGNAEAEIALTMIAAEAAPEVVAEIALAA